MSASGVTVLPPNNLLLSVPSVERADSAALSTDEVDAVTVLGALARVIVEHNRRLLTGEPVDWEALIDLLGDTERTCQRLRASEPSSHDAHPPVGAARPRAAVRRRPQEPPPDPTPIYG
jgi:hypothetical protein